MRHIESMLSGIEAEFRRNVYKVWEYLQEGDLLVTESQGRFFIICVEEYLSSHRKIRIKFIYSLGMDAFYEDVGLESPALVVGYPTGIQIAQLRENVDYLTYQSNNN